MLDKRVRFHAIEFVRTQVLYQVIDSCSVEEDSKQIRLYIYHGPPSTKGARVLYVHFSSITSVSFHLYLCISRLFASTISACSPFTRLVLVPFSPDDSLLDPRRKTPRDESSTNKRVSETERESDKGIQEARQREREREREREKKFFQWRERP